MIQLLRRNNILLLIATFFYVSLQAQLQPLKFITYTTNEGLLHNHIKKCVEDQKGFIWMISEIGLSRFDGAHFKNFQHDETDPSSLPHNTIHDVAVDNSGRIWLALENGLSYYNPKESCFTSIDITGTFTNTPGVLALCVDTVNQSVWFITDKALFSLSTSDFTIKPTSCTNPTPTQINSMYLSSDNRVWIACYRHGFVTYDIRKDEAKINLPNIWVMSFYEADNKMMWMGNWHSDQIVSWNMLTEEHHNWRDTTHSMIVTGITSSPFFDDSMLLVSTQHLGIQLFDTRSNEFKGGFTRDIYSKYSLPTDFLDYIFTDSRNILWLCTWEGLCKVNILEQQFRSLEIPFLSTPMFQYYNLVEGIVASDEPGVWWLGIDGCGLMKYDTAKKQLLLQLLGDITKPNTFALPTWTEYLTKTPDGIIWTANADGMASLKDDVITQYVPDITTLRYSRKNAIIGPDQTFWITTQRHVTNFDPVTKKYASYPFDTVNHGTIPIRVAAQSGFVNDGNLWIGAYHGLFQFDINTHEVKHIQLNNSPTDSLQINNIYSMITDDRETIYMGTPAGLGIYNIRTHQYQLKGKEDNVYPILSKSMLIDKNGNVWIYTTHALFKYDPQQDEFSKFTTSDGIYNFSSDPTGLFSFRQNFYIGYRGAFTEFDPLKVGVNQTMVKPIITDVVIGDQYQKFDPEIYSSQYLRLAAKNNDVTFHFTGIDYTNSDKITFSYKINDESEWKEIGTNRSLTYTNLPPGRYAFQLSARNSSGIVSDQTAIFRLSVAPSLVQRWWFWPLIGFSFVTLVIILAKKQIKKIREEERIKTETNKMVAELETKLLRSQMNPHFIFNSLNSIQKYIWENKEEDAAEYLARFAKLIRAILENSRKEFISLKEELDVLKLYIDLEHRRSNGKFDYLIKVADDLRLEELMLPPLLLQPYVENAIWHGVNKKADHGNIKINISQKTDLLEIIIDDDGVGRQRNIPATNGASHEKTSMGTDITQQRITHLQTKSVGTGVQIVDKEIEGIPAGTTVILTVPVKYHAHA
ncbi:MAG TPA: histidine kinase [Saprospiraceae bacterium]|nr:histidine kinase [Saprospiraceae bacterium]